MRKISVRVIPNSSRTEVVSFSDGVIKIKVMDPANDGRANESLVRFLVKTLSIKSITITSGLRSKNKIIDLGKNFSDEEITNRLGL